MVKTLSLYYWDTKLIAWYGVIGWIRESRNSKKVIRELLMESYGEIGRVPINLYKICDFWELYMPLCIGYVAVNG